MRPAQLPQFLHNKGTNRLAVLVRIVFLIVAAVTMLIILGIGRAISSNIADDSSRRLARQYSIEAAANFLVSVNPHFVLMQQMARSTVISRWFANEHDPEIKAMAFEQIMGYAVFLPHAYIMFTIYGTQNAYDFSVDLTIEEFLSWGIVPHGYHEAQWFFETRDADAPFILNVQRTRYYGIGYYYIYIWSNNRIYYQSRFVGVVTVGTPFEDIFYATFGDFDMNHKRGYIIDRNGAVRVDSAQLLTVIEGGIPTRPALPEAADNPILSASINTHLQRMVDGVFRIGEDTLEAIPLPVGIYRYASITPVIGTDWSVVVLSNHLDAFGGARYHPLIFAAVAVMILFVLIGNLLMRNMAFLPLFKLTQSALQASDITTKANLFGLERKDEIGDLARTIHFMRGNLNSANVELRENERVIIQTQKVLKHREKLLNTINQAAEILLTANENDTMNALMTSMELVGRCLDVDCVQIWHDEEIDGESYFVMRYEWRSAFGKQKAECPVGFKLPGNIRTKWLEIFLRGDCINEPASKLSPEEAAFLESYHVVSTAMLPLVLNDEFFGFFSIDDCHQERIFTKDEMDIFASASLMFANVFNRNMQRDLAYTDALTGARNRRYLMDVVEQQLKDCLDSTMDFSLLMLDIDHFKSINDHYGHACGDEILKILTSRIRHILKQDTPLIRYGGEEFVVTLSGVDHENAKKTAWRLQKTVEASAFRVGTLEITVTASFGVASKTDSCTTLSDIIYKADAALYRAKAAGRNTVISYFSATA